VGESQTLSPLSKNFPSQIWGQSFTDALSRPAAAGNGTVRDVSGAMYEHSDGLCSPIQSPVVILAIKELDLFKCVRAREVTADVRVHGKECVERCGTRFLGPNHQEPGQLLTCFVMWPDSLMPYIITRILKQRAQLLVATWHKGGNDSFYCNFLKILTPQTGSPSSGYNWK
jgi:hypothetical protein